MGVNNGKTWLFRAVLLIVFLALLFYILFLVNGYQYDFLSHQIRKTGIIEITYADPQAKVYLDGKKLEGTLPFVAGNVLPGTYTMAIAREGYKDYSLKVKVQEDLIAMVDEVFLFPIDVLGGSRLVMDWDNSIYKPFLISGYFFRWSSGSLSWAKLREDLNEANFLQSTINGGELQGITVIGKEALLEFADGEREIVNLFTAVTTKVSLSDNYVFAGDKWLYFEKNWVAGFDRNLGRVLWVKTLSGVTRVAGVNYFRVGDREFLSIDGGNEGGLFELKGADWVKLAGAAVQEVSIDNSNKLFFVEKNREIWQWNDKKQVAEFLARFEEKLINLSVDLNFYKTNGVLLFQTGKKTFLTDQYFRNSQELFNGIEVDQLEVVDQKKLFYVNNYQKTPGDKTQGRLLMLNLEG